nr:carcinine hydrolase/isopenicillin-N N-acyltransferase family protein [uncultured Fluviicola sp.]
MKQIRISLLLSTLLFITNGFTCTIFSAKDKKGQVWVGNNEDNLFTFKSLINIVPPKTNCFGYVYLTYNNSSQGMQGGFNEAGLFFDFNGVPDTERKVESTTKEHFPGGNRKMFEYIMEHLTTVQEVIDLYKKYEVWGIEHAQLHLADRYGDLGIIVADSMWITSNNHLVSTNYNVCHADHDGDECFRMPIAERLLKNNEPSFDLLTQICDSTHQFYPSGVGTIYSNIHNLTTGEVWFYFGSDFKTAHKTTVQELLKLGSTSMYVCDLFIEQPLVKAHIAAKNKENKRAIQIIYSIKDSTERFEKMRLLVTGLLDMDADFDSYPIFEHYLKSITWEAKDFWVNAVALYCRGQKEKALESVTEGLKKYPTDEGLGLLNDQLHGKFPADANYRLELEGFENAGYVLLEDFSYFKLECFLVKEGDKWVGEFPLTPDEYFFSFNVDGKRVLAPQFETALDDGVLYNRVVVK